MSADISVEEIRRFIRANLPTHPVPGIPEIRLHNAHPQSNLRSLAERDENGFGTPYWAHCWAGGLALARCILDNPDYVSGRRVLDLGTGSGLVAIACVIAGAGHVTAADIDPYAIIAAGLNAEVNNLEIETHGGDLLPGPPPAVDMVLVGDLFYEVDLAGRVMGFLDRCIAGGIAVLVGDPWRSPLPSERLRQLARYDTADFGGVTKVTSGVFAYKGLHG